MYFDGLTTGKYVRRVNRFIAEVALADGSIVTCHLANTGRMGELLIAGRACLIRPAKNPTRKTAWDLICIDYNGQWVCLLAVWANHIFAQWLEDKKIIFFNHYDVLQREKKIGDSRFDFYLEQDDAKWLIEVKSVNYVIDGHARFPDAPTSRGRRHVENLLMLRKEGYRIGIIFVTMGQTVEDVSFNWQSDPAFAEIMQKAAQTDSYIKAFSAAFEPPKILFCGERPIYY